MKETYKLQDVPDHQGMIEYLADKSVFIDDVVAESLRDFTFNEFTLEELNLPPANELLDSVLKIKNLIGLVGWKTKNHESNHYRGFSLTYNPDYYDSSISINHQTWGSDLLEQSYGKVAGLGEHQFIKNTYYDTYSFRKTSQVIDNHLGCFLKRFKFPIFRSRVAFYDMSFRPANIASWHVDEPSPHLLRINIPLQTSPEHVLEIKGSDEFENHLSLIKHLEVGKAYIWNTRIPHKVDITKPIVSKQDRIHIVLGLSPWIDYDPNTDSYFKSEYFGLSMKEIVEKKLFLKS